MQTLFENTVRFDETDAQGIVYFGNYLTYLDETFHAYMDAVGFPYDELRQVDWDVHVVNSELNYHASAEFRDKLENKMRIAAIGNTSITFEYECFRVHDAVLIVDGRVVYVAIDDAEQPITVPENFRDAVQAFQKTSLDPI